MTIAVRLLDCDCASCLRRREWRARRQGDLIVCESDEPAVAAEVPNGRPLNLALVVGLAAMPIIIAAGFLLDALR